MLTAWPGHSVLQKFERAPEEEWEGLVARNHEYMQTQFFEYWERSLTLDSKDTEEDVQLAQSEWEVPLAPCCAAITVSERSACDVCRADGHASEGCRPGQRVAEGSRRRGVVIVCGSRIWRDA